MVDNIEYYDAIRRAAVEIARVTMFSANDVVAMAVSLSRVFSGDNESFDGMDCTLYPFGEAQSKKLRSTAKAVARSHHNAGNQKRTRHGRAHPTRKRR